MREFITAVTAESESLEGTEETIGSPITYKIDDREVTFTPPTTSQIAMVLALEGADLRDMIAGFLNFFFGLLEKKDETHFRRRLFDGKDPFGVVQIRDIAMSLVEEWSARPTQAPTASSDSPPTSGPRSTAKRRSRA